MNDPTGGILTFVAAIVTVTIIVAFFMLVHYAGETRSTCDATRRACERQLKILHVMLLAQSGVGIAGRVGRLEYSVDKDRASTVLLDGITWECVSDKPISGGRRVTVSGLADDVATLKVSELASS